MVAWSLDWSIGLVGCVKVRIGRRVGTRLCVCVGVSALMGPCVFARLWVDGVGEHVVSVPTQEPSTYRLHLTGDAGASVSISPNRHSESPLANTTRTTPTPTHPHPPMDSCQDCRLKHQDSNETRSLTNLRQRSSPRNNADQTPIQQPQHSHTNKPFQTPTHHPSTCAAGKARRQPPQEPKSQTNPNTNAKQQTRRTTTHASGIDPPQTTADLHRTFVARVFPWASPSSRPADAQLAQKKRRQHGKTHDARVCSIFFRGARQNEFHPVSPEFHPGETLNLANVSRNRGVKLRVSPQFHLGFPPEFLRTRGSRENFRKKFARHNFFRKIHQDTREQSTSTLETPACHLRRTWTRTSGFQRSWPSEYHALGTCFVFCSSRLLHLDHLHRCILDATPAQLMHDTSTPVLP